MGNILITGATGFVGANLARRLLKDSHSVHLLVREGYSEWRISEIESDVKLHSVSLSDAERVLKLVEELQPQWVFHLAAHGAYSWQTDWQEMVKTNIEGTINLAEACAQTGCEAFINAGSSSEYGFKDHAPDEEEFPEPNSHYSSTKLAATQYCRFLGKKRGVPAITLRLYSVYGAYESSERFIPNLIVRGFDGKLPALAHPEIARDYVYVEDVCDAFIAAAQHAKAHAGSVWNVGTGTQTTIREAVELSSTMLGVMEQPRFGSMPNRSWDTQVWRADIKRIRQDLVWSPTHTLERGLAKTIAWFRQNESQLDRYRRQLDLVTVPEN